MTAPIWLLGPDPSNQCCGCETRLNPCDSCSTTGSCCYTIGAASTPEFATPTVWTDLTTAQAELTKRTYNCLVCGSLFGITYPQGALTASNAGSVLHIVGSVTSPSDPAGRVDTFRFHAAVGTISIPFTLTCATPVTSSLNVEADLWVDGGTSPISFDYQASSPGVTNFSGTLILNITVAGQYIIALTYQSTSYNRPFTGTFDVSSNASISFCTIRAAYLSSGNIKYTFPSGCGECTESCYLKLPSIMDGGSYTTQAAAQAAISTFTSGCIVEGKDFSNNPLPSLTATLGTSSLNIAANVAAVTTGLILFAVTVTALGDIHVGYNFTCTGTVGSTFTLYDASLTPISSQNSAVLVGSILFTIPSDGQYYVKVFIASNPPNPAVAVALTVTSDDIMDVCVVRAAYDDGTGTKYVYCP